MALHCGKNPPPWNFRDCPRFEPRFNYRFLLSVSITFIQLHFPLDLFPPFLPFAFFIFHIQFRVTEETAEICGYTNLIKDIFADSAVRNLTMWKIRGFTAEDPR